MTREIIENLVIFTINFILIMIVLALHDYDKEYPLILLLWVMAFINYVLGKVTKN